MFCRTQCKNLPNARHSVSMIYKVSVQDLCETSEQCREAFSKLIPAENSHLA